MYLSYAQNMEDYHLWLAFGGQRSGTYIDVGAGHPIADNVSFFFYERGWQGIVVEPQRNLIDLYSRVRPRDTGICALIGTRSGLTDFHVFDAFHGLSTTSEKHAGAARSLGAAYQTIQVPMISLAQLCKDHAVSTIDFFENRCRGRRSRCLEKRRLGPLPAESCGGRSDHARVGRTIVAGMGTLPYCPRISVCIIRHPQSFLCSGRSAGNCYPFSGRARSLGFGSAHV
jgi:FkbM family methyltransferase